MKHYNLVREQETYHARTAPFTPDVQSAFTPEELLHLLAGGNVFRGDDESIIFHLEETDTSMAGEAEVDIIENPSEVFMHGGRYITSKKTNYGKKWYASPFADGLTDRAASYSRSGTRAQFLLWLDSKGPVTSEERDDAQELIKQTRNPSFSSRITEAYKDVKKSKSAAAMRRLEEAQRPVEGGMVRPGKFGLEKQNPSKVSVLSAMLDSTHVMEPNNGLKSYHAAREVIQAGRIKDTYQRVAKVKRILHSFRVIVSLVGDTVRVYRPDTQQEVFVGSSTKANPESSASDFESEVNEWEVKAYRAGQLAKQQGKDKHKAFYEWMPEIVNRRGTEFERLVRAAFNTGYSMKRNPEDSASDLYEDFHGRAPSELVEVHYDVHEHENLTSLGYLCSLVVKTRTGKRLINVVETKSPRDVPNPLTLPMDKRVMLCSNEAATSMYFVGGDQAVDLAALSLDEEQYVKDLMVLGTLEQVTYMTQKAFDDFEDISYYHALGEETGEKPLLLYDPVSCLLSVAGGAYSIRAEGITN